MGSITDTHPQPGVRVAARVLLVDPGQRLLLFQGFDPHVPDRSFWFTAGGGLDAGEELRAAALRELREETGLRVEADRMVGPMWLRRARFSFEGVEYGSEEWFFLAALADPAVVDTGGFTDLENRTVLGHRWWSAPDLRATTETIYPVQLPELLPGLFTDGWDGVLRLVD